MSRFSEDDNDSEWWMLDMGRWQANLQSSLKGKRGQRALADLEDALLAMPVKSLLHGRVCEIDVYDPGFGWTFEVPAFCAVGLYAHPKGADLGALTADYLGDCETAQIGESAGMSFTLAWHIGDLNDVEWNERMTGEQRWKAALAWVREKRVSGESP